MSTTTTGNSPERMHQMSHAERKRYHLPQTDYEAIDKRIEVVNASLPRVAMAGERMYPGITDKINRDEQLKAQGANTMPVAQVAQEAPQQPQPAPQPNNLNPVTAISRQSENVATERSITQAREGVDAAFSNANVTPLRPAPQPSSQRNVTDIAARTQVSGNDLEYPKAA